MTRLETFDTLLTEQRVKKLSDVNSFSDVYRVVKHSYNKTKDMLSLEVVVKGVKQVIRITSAKVKEVVRNVAGGYVVITFTDNAEEKSLLFTLK